jgi:hypothetical protein
MIVSVLVSMAQVIAILAQVLYILILLPKFMYLFLQIISRRQPDIMARLCSLSCDVSSKIFESHDLVNLLLLHISLQRSGRPLRVIGFLRRDMNEFYTFLPSNLCSDVPSRLSSSSDIITASSA